MTATGILVIKLGALGDFVQALGPLKAIRDHHPDQTITLLTTPPFEALAQKSRTVDQVWLDTRPRFYQIGAWLAFRKRLQSAGFIRVYDLQTSDRSGFYYRLFADPRPEWSGIARGCSHPHANPARDAMHTQDRQREQLNMAGIERVPAADLSGLKTDIQGFALPASYGLVIPGGAPHRPGKRWPVAGYGALARHMAGRAITPVVLGGSTETGLARRIVEAAPTALDLTGKTDLLDLVAMARGARFAVGNDTGPMHLAAAAGCPSLVLFSAASDPALCAPRGVKVTVLQRPSLAQLPVREVLDAVQGLG